VFISAPFIYFRGRVLNGQSIKLATRPQTLILRIFATFKK
jgi:hypothetical protein